METFYIIVLTIAGIFLILILTFVGILFTAKNNSVIYPPIQNKCPDYWTDAGNSGCTISDLNVGTLKTANGYKMTDSRGTDGVYTPGYDSTNKKVNFADTRWESDFYKTSRCALKQWANANKIVWDGVSNYNGC
jgi:hypothetical protein